MPEDISPEELKARLDRKEPVVLLAEQYLRAVIWCVLPYMWFTVLRNFVSALARPGAIMVITVAAVGLNLRFVVRFQPYHDISGFEGSVADLNPNDTPLARREDRGQWDDNSVCSRETDLGRDIHLRLQFSMLIGEFSANAGSPCLRIHHRIDKRHLARKDVVGIRFIRDVDSLADLDVGEVLFINIQVDPHS